jgi:hypothetical protein
MAMPEDDKHDAEVLASRDSLIERGRRGEATLDELNEMRCVCERHERTEDVKVFERFIRDVEATAKNKTDGIWKD